MMPSTAEQVVKSGLCAGCGACAHVAPGKVAMAVSDEGFLRPVVKQAVTRDEDEIVADVCPGARMVQDPDGREDHVLWGPINTVRKGFSAVPSLRWRASSGGILSALLTHLLDTGQVDRIIQTAASNVVPIANTTRISVTREDIADAAGSRYAPSAPLADLEVALSAEGKAAFVGKPCDVAALRALARCDPRIDETIPFMLSFFCAGVPSLAGAHKIIETMGLNVDEVSSFRYRGNGWPGNATATTTDGRTHMMSYDDSWGKILTQHLQFRCKICPDGTAGFADVACADAWTCDEKGYPTFAEQDGLSLVVSRTARGEALVRDCMEAEAISVHTVSVEAIAAMQPGQLRRKRFAFARLVAFGFVRGGGPKFVGFNLRAAAKTAGLARNLRDFAGTCRRLVRQPRSLSRSSLKTRSSQG